MVLHMRTIFPVLAAALLLAACAPATPAPTEPPAEATEAMTGGTGMEMDMGDAPSVPAGIAYAEGMEIRFIHTEASDPEIAQLLSDMMSSPVLHVPSLADVPETARARVYVFTNGVEGTGPLGFQPDVFDNPPGTEGYSPLRTLHTVTWGDESQAIELKSVADLLQAEQDGLVMIEAQPVVINMPFLSWPGGER
jgi:hypothetical protein